LLVIFLKSKCFKFPFPVEVPAYPGMKLTIAQQVISIKVWTEEFPQPIVDPNDNTNLGPML
jgi:hypothetical protein